MIDLQLIFPPSFTELSFPYLSLPALTGYLREKNYLVAQWDSSLEFFHYLRSAEGSQALSDSIQRAIARLEAEEELKAEELKEYRLLCLFKKLSADGLSERLNHTYEVLTNPDYLQDIDEYICAKKFLNQLNELLKTFFQAGQSLQVHQSFKKMELALLDAFFIDRVLPAVSEAQPRAIGFSLAFQIQWGVTFYLLQKLKERFPAIPIVLGGPVVTKLASRLKDQPEIFTAVDFLVVGPGEEVLAQLLDLLNSGGQPSKINNLLFLQNGKVVATPEHTHQERIREYSTPDFAGLSLDRYLTMVKAVPFMISRGCYWGKCTFCDRYSLDFATQRPEYVCKQIQEILEKTQAEIIIFVDEALVPATMERLSTLLTQQGVTPYWTGQLRLEKGMSTEYFKTLYASGCRSIIFGLESGNDQILARMNKGITAAQAADILKNCFQAGISPGINLIVGFPGERIEEAQATFDFVFANQAYIDRLMSIEAYNVMVGSIIAEQLDEYGIILPTEEADDFLLWYDNFSVVTGIAPDEARGLIAEFVGRVVKEAPNLLEYVYYPYLCYPCVHDVHSFQEIETIARAKSQIKSDVRKASEPVTWECELELLQVDYDLFLTEDVVRKQPMTVAIDEKRMLFFSGKKMDIYIIDCLKQHMTKEQICQELQDEFALNLQKAELYYNLFIRVLQTKGYV